MAKVTLSDDKLFTRLDFDPTDLTPRIRKELRQTMRASVKRITAQAKRAAPRGQRDIAGQRHLQDAISGGVKTIRRQPKGPLAWVTAPVKHALVVEYGGRKGRGPDPYAGRHAGRRNISRAARPYLLPSYESERQRFAEAVAAVFAREVDRVDTTAANATVTMEDRDQT